MGQPGTRAGARRVLSDPPDRKALTLLVATALLFAIYALPLPAPLERAGNLIPLTANGKACLALLAFAVTLWVTETLPFAATSLLVVLLIPAFGIAEYRTIVRAGFGDPVITFFIGVLILSAAFTQSGLGTRLTYLVLLRVGTRTDRVLLGILTVGALISMWITDIAVAAMLLPLGVGLLHDAGLRPGQSNFGRSLMIATAVGLGAGVALFLPGIRVLSWKEAEAQVEWGGVMLIVAGLSLGVAVYDTGAARWLAWVLLGHITAVPPPLRPFIIVLAVAGLHMLFSSNTVAASI